MNIKNIKKLALLLLLLVSAVALVSCDGDDESVDVGDNPTEITDEQQLQELMELGMTEEEASEMINEHRRWLELGTPLDYHLSEEVATEIILQMIYEEFDVVIDVEEIPTDDTPSRISLGLEFRHEDWSADGRSFWMGTITIYDVIYSDIRAMLHHFSIRIDGITGEKDILRDELQVELAFEPFITEISLNDAQLTILDSTRELDIMDDPSYANRIPDHLSTAEIGELIAKAVYEELGVNLDGHFILMNLTHFSEYSSWSAEVATENNVCTSIALVNIDAKTGEIRFIGESNHSTDNPFGLCYLGND